MTHDTRKVTVSGNASIMDNFAFDRIVLQQQPTVRIQFVASGSMANILRAAADVVDGNLMENESLTLTVRSDYSRERADAKARALHESGRDQYGYAYKESNF